MDKRVIEKYIEYITTKFKILHKEKNYTTENTQIKYILETVKDSNDLMILFNGIPRKGVKGRYNYMRTTKDLPVNRLFILDDFGYDNRGNYYLGKSREFHTAEAVILLIASIKEKINATAKSQIYYVGSSKGGWASLFFGVRDKGSHIISGSPQYKLGNFLISDETREKNIMKYIMSDTYNEADVHFLNTLLKNTLNENHKNDNHIYLHYSDNEPIFVNHVFDLLKDLELNQYDVYEDVRHYEKHAEIALYFPEYIRNTFIKLNSNG